MLQADALRGSLARKVGRENAEDIVGKAFTRLAEKLEDTPVKDGPALLGSIVSGLLIDHYRAMDFRRANETPVGLQTELDDELREQRGVPTFTVDTYEFQKDFDSAIRGLDPDDRDAFIVTELRGLPVREAADVLATSKDTVHRRAEAARTIIRQEVTA
jgi:RNA polymerase sigma factor (sigma-70 family)